MPRVAQIQGNFKEKNIRINVFINYDYTQIDMQL